MHPAAMLQPTDISAMAEARDDDYCEQYDGNEAGCNADSQCEWDAEDDPTDDDYPGECDEADDDEDDEDDEAASPNDSSADGRIGETNDAR